VDIWHLIRSCAGKATRLVQIGIEGLALQFQLMFIVELSQPSTRHGQEHGQDMVGLDVDLKRSMCSEGSPAFSPPCQLHDCLWLAHAPRSRSGTRHSHCTGVCVTSSDIFRYLQIALLNFPICSCSAIILKDSWSWMCDSPCFVYPQDSVRSYITASWCMFVWFVLQKVK